MLKNILYGHKSGIGICLCIMLCFFVTEAFAQTQKDSLRLSLSEAESLFIKNNLSLLAAKYNIDANKALIEQAKLWDNPILVTDQNIYADNKFFAHGKDANGQVTGQYFIQIQQLIKTAGKRSKWISMAATNAKISELQFNEVMRNLKYQLRTDYFSIAQKIGVHELYQKELHEIKLLLEGMKFQLSSGNIAKKDYLRIEALVLSLNQDLVENDRQLADEESDLKSLLQINGNVFIRTTERILNLPKQTLTIETILDTSRLYNSAYQIEQTQLIYQQQNLSYQKALKVPDLTIGPEYDHNSNYAPHYVGLSISLPLTIFNRNQGNIKSAQYAIKQEETTLLQVQQQLSTSIQKALNKFYLTKEYSGVQEQNFYQEYASLLNNITESYRQRQISLIEFIDFFDAFRDAELNHLNQDFNLHASIEEINYLAGKDIIN